MSMRTRRAGPGLIGPLDPCIPGSSCHRKFWGPVTLMPINIVTGQPGTEQTRCREINRIIRGYLERPHLDFE